MDLDEARRRARFALEAIRPSDEVTDRAELELKQKWKRGEVSREEVPVPDLVYFALTELRGFTSWGPHEKLRWAIDFSFEGRPFSIRMEKFGLNLYFPADIPDDKAEELLRVLIRGTKIAEGYLDDIAALQIAAGNVTIQNQYGRFEGAYRFFREKAREAFATLAPERVIEKRNEAGEPTAWSQNLWKYQIEGGYYASAMLDAFFSRLEHELVLVLPFLDFDPSDGKLVEFVGSTWDEKWRRVFDNSKDSAAGDAYSRLKKIKESFRNPIFHGGFAKKGGSFFFHVPGVGALPALMTRVQALTFDDFLTPVSEPKYKELCENLDKIDEFLSRSVARFGVKFAESGLNVAFSANFRDLCKEASDSDKTLEEFIDEQIELADRHANMDY